MWLSKNNGEEDGTLRCMLCPHSCLLKPGERGICRVRENRDGMITLLTYGIISGYAADPVEKKPLYHFFPGRNIISVGSYGCNLSCDFCQNHHISQNGPPAGSTRLSPEELVARAVREHNNIGIAYTYNEPVIWYEYVTDSANLAAAAGLKNVMVTNGYITRKPLEELTNVIDAFNIDLKAFSNDFYRRYTGATLKPVLDAIGTVALSGKHLEITTLILPGLNDSAGDMRHMAEWIAGNAGRNVPLHLSRYFPMYLRETPATPEETILKLKDIASESLDFVYTGNMSGRHACGDTLCPSCKTVVVKRSGYQAVVTGLTGEGHCSICNEEIMKWV
jgi:pyruvate formate lyase activating enzyme